MALAPFASNFHLERVVVNAAKTLELQVSGSLSCQMKSKDSYRACFTKHTQPTFNIILKGTPISYQRFSFSLCKFSSLPNLFDAFWYMNNVFDLQHIVFDTNMILITSRDLKCQCKYRRLRVKGHRLVTCLLWKQWPLGHDFRCRKQHYQAQQSHHWKCIERSLPGHDIMKSFIKLAQSTDKFP